MLIAEWRAVLRHAWSVRLMLLAAALNGLSIALSIDPFLLPIPLPLAASAAGVADFAAVVSRFFAQPRHIPRKRDHP